jgi:hypothetical protein
METIARSAEETLQPASLPRSETGGGDVLDQTRSCAGLADLVWMTGAALMGALSLVRVPPVALMVNFRSVIATAAMMVAPAFINPKAGVTKSFVVTGPGGRMFRRNRE